MARAYIVHGRVIEGEVGKIRESQFFKNLHLLSLETRLQSVGNMGDIKEF